MKKISVLVILLSALSSLAMTDFQFFESDIDYWREKSKKEHKMPTKETETKEEKSSFEWKKYLDPKNKEFFKEA